MPVDRKLLEILRCPVTKQPVSPLSTEKLAALNKAIETEEVQYQDGSKIDTPVEEALITDNGRTIYRVDEDIPIMLEDQSIPTEQLQNF